jgi:hypothetical protein
VYPKLLWLVSREIAQRTRSNYTLIFDIGSPMYLPNEGLAGGGVSLVMCPGMNARGGKF